MDEVGRGALAGPVSVGVVVVDVRTRRPPRGLTDSKLLAPDAREALVPRVRSWGVAYAVGHASNLEVDDVGIIGALRLAGRRALAEVAARGVRVDAVLLDGSHDWLTDPAPDLLDVLAATEPDTGPAHDVEAAPRRYRPLDPALLPAPVPPLGVRTLVKADVQCASVAAASVLAKCERDAMMRVHAGDHPGYAWEKNKGYSTATHMRALGELGPSPLHRTSWNLPGRPARGSDADLGASAGVDGP
jgi:ribonuclease HII